LEISIFLSSANHVLLPDSLPGMFVAHLSLVVYSSLLQTRPSLRGSAFAAARLSSTLSRPIALKDRLGEIIPKEIENVFIYLSSLSGFLNPIAVGKSHSC
jgi:hypothetical protein